MTDIPEIAASLSEAGKRWLLGDEYHLRPYCRDLLISRGLAEYVSVAATKNKLRRTDLGLAVRAHLETAHD